MVNKSMLRNPLLLAFPAVLLAIVVTSDVFAAAEDEAAVAKATAEGRQFTSVGEGIRGAGIALAAGIAMVGAAFGTARAQAAIGAGGTGALAEKPELFMTVLVLVALPETIVILGFVIGFLIIRTI